jgi:hypothetical protein
MVWMFGCLDAWMFGCLDVYDKMEDNELERLIHILYRV